MAEGGVMTDKLDSIFTKLDRMHDDLGAVKTDIALLKQDVGRNTDDLERHMEQTRLLKTEMNNRVTPIEDHIKMLGGWKVGLSLLAASSVWIVTLLKTLGVF